MVNTVDLRKYIGPVQGAEIIDSTGFDSLAPDVVFIKRELTLQLSDGTRAPFANPEYLEFVNSPTGREKLNKSGLDQKLIDSIMLVWGNKAIVADNQPIE